jgi:hypothetical protein
VIILNQEGGDQQVSDQSTPKEEYSGRAEFLTAINYTDICSNSQILSNQTERVQHHKPDVKRGYDDEFLRRDECVQNTYHNPPTFEDGKNGKGRETRRERVWYQERLSYGRRGATRETGLEMLY